MKTLMNEIIVSKHHSPVCDLANLGGKKKGGRKGGRETQTEARERPKE